MPEKRGIERNIFAKRFIKEIIYSKEEIEIHFYYSFFADEKEAKEGGVSRLTAEGCKGTKAPYRQSLWREPRGVGLEKNTLEMGKTTVRGVKNGSFSNRIARIVPIILPNTIHGSKKKDLKG